MIACVQDRELYARLLGLTQPWVVTEVELRLNERVVNVMVSRDPNVPLTCTTCGAEVPRYDSRVRRWRHLDTMQYQTFLVADVPRAKCPEHGVHQVHVPWAEEHSRFTALFEVLAIDWLREASIEAVARMLGLSWDEVAGIQRRAVERGLARRKLKPTPVLGVDETSFKRRHDYVTVLCDAERGRVLSVLDGREKEPLARCLKELPAKVRAKVSFVAMDMSAAYIGAVSEELPNAVIAFDRFHVAKHLNEAVDKVRRTEHRELLEAGNALLGGTRYHWLQNPEDMEPERRKAFIELRSTKLRVARAWALKETARHLWGYRSRTWAEKAWCRWLGWAQRCRLPPLVKVARTIRNHLDGVVNAAASAVTNALSESINSRIQAIKRRACGFRNRERFKMAIYFHLGGLDLYPRTDS
jgi:transposase